MEEYNFKLERFKEFLRENGCSFDNNTMDLIYTPAKGVGIYFTKNITFNKETPAFSIPSFLLINQTKCLSFENKELHTSLERIQPYYSERYTLMLLLLWWRKRGQIEYSNNGYIHSKNHNDPYFFAPYFDVLPEHISATKYFNDQDLTQLEGTELYQAAIAKQGALRREYDLLSPCFDTFSSSVTIEDFFWADGIFFSRALSFQSWYEAHGIELESHEFNDDYHLVPLLDFVNHENDAPLHWTLNSSLPVSILLTSFETSSFKKDQELTISYGNFSNSSLLFAHGFCVPNNPNDAVSLNALELLRKSNEDSRFPTQVQESLSLFRQLLFESCQLSPILTFQLSDLQNDFVLSQSMNCALYITSLTPSDELSISFFSPSSTEDLSHRILISNNDCKVHRSDDVYFDFENVTSAMAKREIEDGSPMNFLAYQSTITYIGCTPISNIENLNELVLKWMNTSLNYQNQLQQIITSLEERLQILPQSLDNPHIKIMINSQRNIIEKMTKNLRKKLTEL